MKLFILTLSLVSIVNCLNYDFHPEYLRGTTFYKTEKLEKKDSDFLYPEAIYLGNPEGVKFLEKSSVQITELVFLVFFTGKYIGPQQNGELSKICKIKKESYELKENEMLVVYDTEIIYKSNFFYDVVGDLPGGYLRYYPYTFHYKLGVIKSPTIKSKK
jgi:hypothetical protein